MCGICVELRRNPISIFWPECWHLRSRLHPGFRLTFPALLLFPGTEQSLVVTQLLSLHCVPASLGLGLCWSQSSLHPVLSMCEEASHPSRPPPHQPPLAPFVVAQGVVQAGGVVLLWVFFFSRIYLIIQMTWEMGKCFLVLTLPIKGAAWVGTWLLIEASLHGLGTRRLLRAQSSSPSLWIPPSSPCIGRVSSVSQALCFLVVVGVSQSRNDFPFSFLRRTVFLSHVLYRILGHQEQNGDEGRPSACFPSHLTSVSSLCSYGGRPSV